MRALAFFGMAVLSASLTLLPSSAEARRTAIDQDPNGNPITTLLSGYCDLNGDDCNPITDGLTLPYSVSFGGGAFTSKVFIHGNSIVTFGQPINFAPFVTAITNGVNDGSLPTSQQYGPKTLINAGQILDLDPLGNGGFYQSGSLSLLSNGVIFAEWFTCLKPGPLCHANSYSITLTPTTGGFDGLFQFGPDGVDYTKYQLALADREFMVEGVAGADGKIGSPTPYGSTFFMPATFRGLGLSAVPEPSVWAMLILGFGFVGASMRRRAERVSTAKGQQTSI
ncbi:PEPxxWA-CTERM sorting domain-containing protein [Aquisediminimonas profunda]|uniref:PEPxxWA-CTERM sorting domain-containing protein n=1 Tax=Aquisediminimonas profunda TaxID=1550733 RepID=UPI001FE76BD5|nr:PEPxxWA-CTERM sorting domain-containing protein [Aquisediminimonas profunda]